MQCAERCARYLEAVQKGSRGLGKYRVWMERGESPHKMQRAKVRPRRETIPVALAGVQEGEGRYQVSLLHPCLKGAPVMSGLRGETGAPALGRIEQL